MQCEICGRLILGQPKKTIVEGAKLTVCEECSLHGKESWEDPKPRALAYPKSVSKPFRSSKTGSLDDDQVLIPDFSLTIKREREKKGWSQGELASKINEKVSLVSKIETGKLISNIVVTKKLEHLFEIKLTTTIPKVNIDASKTTKTTGLTIGDIFSSLPNKKGGKSESNSS